MADTLDQSEVDALLAAIGSGNTPEAPPPSADRVFGRGGSRAAEPHTEPYDFRRPQHLSGEPLRILTHIHQQFATGLATSLTDSLHIEVNVCATGIEQLPCSDFVRSLTNPTSLSILQCPPLEGRVVLELSPPLVYLLLDRLLGGTTADIFIPQRPLTGIEMRLVSRIVDRAAADLSQAWRRVAPITFSSCEAVSNPGLLQIAAPGECTLVIGFDLSMSGRTGTMNLGIPLKTIEPLLPRLQNPDRSAAPASTPQPDAQRHIAARLQTAPVRIAGILAETTITLHDLLNMAPGDVIVTEKPAHTPVACAVEGRKKFAGHLGQHRGHRALKILQSPFRRDTPEPPR